MDGWCELRKGLRSFTVDRVKNALETTDKAQDIADKDLNDHYASSFGIFAGKANKTEVLRFSKERARWVADERSHPQQAAQNLTDGRYELRIPHRVEREFAMDILWHVADVEVVSPAALCEQIILQIKASMRNFGEY